MASANLVITSSVVTAASSYDLLDLDTAKAEIGISTAADVTILRRYISAASIAAAQFCNRVLVAETIEDDFWPQRDALPRAVDGGLWPLQLSRWPIVTLTSVVENAVTLVENTDFRTDKAKGQLHRLADDLYPKSWPVLPITVTYSAGYATIPADIADAVMRMVRSRWYAKGRDPYTRTENIPGVRDVSYWVPTGADAGNMTPDVTDILSNYRVPVIAG